MAEINIVQRAIKECSRGGRYFQFCLIVSVEVLGDAGGHAVSPDRLLFTITGELQTSKGQKMVTAKLNLEYVRGNGFYIKC